MSKKENLAFQRINYILLIVGILAIALGFTIMSLDKDPHGFGVLGLTIGPLVVMSGFVLEFFAILYRPRK
ncbi:MAG TPA: DUF3098 domain-containing protein [Cyclobacteriaceae bacterium]|jgi:hypothetical protein